MESYPLDVLGMPEIKSMVMSSYFQVGMGKGWRVSANLRCLAFTLQQTSHSATNLAMSFFQTFPQKPLPHISIHLVASRVDREK
jgi:hypothetical protein